MHEQEYVGDLFGGLLIDISLRLEPEESLRQLTDSNHMVVVEVDDRVHIFNGFE